ncbi:MAG: Holliday junction resolvase RuvX [Bacteroidales bacterium]
MAFDYGSKRTGLAVTDPLKIIPGALTTVETSLIFEYLDKYLENEKVELFVVGYPFIMENTKPSHSIHLINAFIKNLKKKYPLIQVTTENEHFTSKMAKQTMIDGGVKKMKRRDKSLIDKVSAVIILQSYMERIK